MLSKLPGGDLPDKFLGLQAAVDEVGFPRRAFAMAHLVAAAIQAVLLGLAAAADVRSQAAPVPAAGSANV